MQNYSSCEKKLHSRGSNFKPPFPLHVKTSGHSRVISFFDIEGGTVLEESDKFKEDKLVERYNTDDKFKTLFDKALDQAINYRINIGMFRNSKALTQYDHGLDDSEFDDV
jgi:hypothetical protein